MIFWSSVDCSKNQTLHIAQISETLLKNRLLVRDCYCLPVFHQADVSVLSELSRRFSSPHRSRTQIPCYMENNEGVFISNRRWNTLICNRLVSHQISSPNHTHLQVEAPRKTQVIMKPHTKISLLFCLGESLSKIICLDFMIVNKIQRGKICLFVKMVEKTT